MKKNKNKNNKFLAISYSLKDAVGINVGGFPIRLNEIALIFTIVLSFTKSHSLKMRRANSYLVLLITISLLLSSIVSFIHIGSIDESFFTKYMVRGILYTIILLIFSFSRKSYGEEDIAYLCKMVVTVNVIFFLVLYTTGYRMELGSLINTHESNFQIMNLFGVSIPRFFGTASESGYMGPFLMMPLYYYFYNFLEKRKNGRELIILAVMILMTFSAIAYFLAIFACFIALRKSGKIGKKVFVWIVILIVGIFGTLFYFTNDIFNTFLNTYFLNKVNAFIGGNSRAFDYSGTDRNLHIQNCINLFNKQSIINKIFGAGTGAYAHLSISNTSLYSAAEEAYNLYLSTLLDRGMLGVVVLILIGVCISKFHLKGDYVSTSIYVGIISQYIHWMITGNMWLCYFWMEVMYLIGYYERKRYQSVHQQ